ncbi:uncharacterized protein UTRI_04492 [Ustilago trichophora]|uniref:Uncharacterized protein n=1 Tax=Ustilago trichophora TaxID=86804 RepID=A0A5C3ED52_9BASI|nr:uncharacterized protein UTRI_04492 [Ustilago trichophora]
MNSYIRQKQSTTHNRRGLASTQMRVRSMMMTCTHLEANLMRSGRSFVGSRGTPLQAPSQPHSKSTVPEIARGNYSTTVSLPAQEFRQENGTFWKHPAESNSTRSSSKMTGHTSRGAEQRKACPTVEDGFA